MRVPPLPEMLRVKAFLVVQRSVTRDYLDTVALAERLGVSEATDVLGQIAEYYADRSRTHGSVLTALVARLAEPSPRDVRVTAQLSSDKGLDPRWHDWDSVVAACQDLADHLLRVVEDGLS